MDPLWRDALLELIRAAPWGTVIIILRYMDNKAEAQARKERSENAKEKSEFDRQTQVLVSQNYANAINALAKSTDDSASRIVATLTEFRASVSEQYEKMGVTADLLDMARAELARGGKK